MRLRSLAIALWLAVPCVAQDGGGRDVSVALFTTQAVQTVTLAPAGAGAWTARCANCAHQPLTRSLVVSGSMDVFAGGTLRATDDASRASRTAAGLWHLRGNGARHTVDAVLTLPSERYVAAVLNAEPAAHEPAQSLRAMAIVARTYALNGRHYTPSRGHLPADLCDSTACQTLSLKPPTAAVEEATRATAGETLWFGQRRAEVFFSQSCGGLTEDARAVWHGARNEPYLRSHADPYCLRRSRDAWHAEVPLRAVSAIAKSEGWHLPAQIVAARIVQRSASHRALRIAFTGSDGATAVVAGNALRMAIGRALGWNQVRSDAYELGLRHGALVFDGQGHGHGVGLCQLGATEMASEGKSAREILGFYFPGTKLRITATDEGWQETRIGPLTVRSTQAVSAARQAEIAQTWAQAQQRFPPRRALSPTLVLAPTTELFRQLTGQPGWMLASTQGSVIVLQPEAVFKANRAEPASTLLHEMLHAEVEAECSARAPLWLREGLVEVLAGDRIEPAAPMPTQAIEAELLHPSSRVENERAHKAAAAKARGLIARYGASPVRGWLLSGVPTGVA